MIYTTDIGKFEIRISCFEFRAFSFRKAEPLNSDLALKTRFFLRE